MRIDGLKLLELHARELKDLHVMPLVNPSLDLLTAIEEAGGEVLGKRHISSIGAVSAAEAAGRDEMSIRHPYVLGCQR